MTQAEWIAAYYPISAKACPEHEAVTHSLRKWEGIAWAMENESKFVLPINPNSETCALCQHHYDPAPEAKVEEQPCVRCPLAISLGRRCDDDGEDDEIDGKREPAPWYEWANNHNPLPMLAALRAIPS